MILKIFNHDNLGLCTYTHTKFKKFWNSEKIISWWRKANSAQQLQKEKALGGKQSQEA